MNPATKTFYLFRHGKTTMNELGKCFSGVSDVSLSENGKQALSAAARNPLLQEMEIVYISNLKRTAETADILFPHIPQIVIPEFAEMNFGDYEGKMLPEDDSDPIIRLWRHNPRILTFPNGENIAEHAALVHNRFCTLAEECKYTKIALVSHATSIRLLLAILLGADIGIFRNIPCDNGCFTQIQYTDGQFTINAINVKL